MSGGELNIWQIEIDFSWALIHSVCNAFLKSDLDTYLDKCWNAVKHPEERVIDLKVILHLCSVHLIHGISFNLNKKFKIDLNVQKLILHSIGFIVKSTDLSKINNVFDSLCFVFCSKVRNTKTNFHISKLESFIFNNNPEISDFSEPECMDDIPISNNKANSTYRQKSSFGKHFVRILECCQEELNDVDHFSNSSESNPCYNPEIIEYLLTYYLPILPLWSGIILGNRNIESRYNMTHYSNAIVENWMRIIKLDILHSKTNLRPVYFIRNLYPDIVSRLSAFKFAFHPRASKVFNRHKRSRDTSEEYCNEEWDRRKKIFSGYLHSISSVKNLFRDWNS